MHTLCDRCKGSFLFISGLYRIRGRSFCRSCYDISKREMDIELERFAVYNQSFPSYRRFALELSEMLNCSDDEEPLKSIVDRVKELLLIADNI